MEYLTIFITVAIAHFLAVISPGPDFIMITRNSLLYSRKTGVYSALGLGLGILVHVTYSLIGLGLLISKSIVLFSIIKYLGAAYLIYIGYKSLTAKHTNIGTEHIDIKKKNLNKFQAIKMGFITNVTNPKATLFFLSLFTLIVGPSISLYFKVIMGVEMSFVTFAWFAFISILFSHRIIKKRVTGIQHFAERFIGVILIALGIKLALSSAK
ncbi:MAG: LysE family transporter [Candidatus Levybacteria bacterium]|nr:LysE family transporter [Candidatus Levybacteria bacterium]